MLKGFLRLERAEIPEFQMPSLDPGFQLVGKALSRFAGVEWALSLVFVEIMCPQEQTPQRGAALSVFEQARHVETKLRIVRDAMHAVLDGDELKTATNLANRVAARAELRNKLAHWTVGYWPSVASTQDLRRLKVVLAPPPYAQRYFAVMAEREQPIHLEQIEEFCLICEQLANDLLSFLVHLQARKV